MFVNDELLTERWSLSFEVVLPEGMTHAEVEDALEEAAARMAAQFDGCYSNLEVHVEVP